MTFSGEAGNRQFTVEDLPASRLETDEGVQRRLNIVRVRKIAGSFDPSALGIFTVSARQALVMPGAPGDVDEKVRYVVLDGQTRLAALRLFTGTPDTDMPVLCQVYSGLTRAEEAEIFLRHNDRAAVRSVDKFRIALVAGEKWAVELHALVAEHGFKVGADGPPERRFMAVSSALKILALSEGGPSLSRALDLIVRSWGHRVSAASAEAVDGLSLLYQRHGENVDTVGFARRLARTDTPATFKAHVLEHRGALRIPRTEAAYRYTLAVYNSGLRTRRLEPMGPRS